MKPTVEPPVSCNNLERYKFISSSVLNEIISSTLCCQCKSNSLQLYQNDAARKGLNEPLVVYCHNCNFQNEYSTSCKSNTNTKVSDVNLRGTLAIISAGGGHSSLKKFCSTMDLPAPVTSHPYNSHVKKLSAICEKQCQKNLSGAANRLKLFLKKNKEDLVDCAVTVDGTWQKRYGHNSKLGATFVLSADTGEVLDYEVKSTYCKECRPTECTLLVKSIKFGRKTITSINHHGSADAMEKDSAVEIFCRSAQKHNLRYTVYVGEDTSSFGEVKEALYNKFQNEYPVKKEDCIGHIQKGMGSALACTKTNAVEAMEKRLVAGCLTDLVIDRIHGVAIRSNIGKPKEMQNAIWAIYFHMIMGPSN